MLMFRIEGSGDERTISSVLNGFSLIREGNRIIQSNGGGNYKWRFVPQSNGSFLIQSTSDGQCLTLVNRKPEVGSCSSPSSNILVTEEDLSRHEKL
jgi:hypothetical protein